MLLRIKRSLAAKLLISYFIVVLVGVIVLMSAAEWHAPAAVRRHAIQMQQRLGVQDNLVLEAVQRDFRDAVNEVLVVAAVAATMAAVLTSIFVSRRIVQPILSIEAATRDLAAGHYERRLPVRSEDELGALAAAFNRMAEVLEATEKRRMALIGDVSHELRTPLASIRSVVEGLGDGVLPPTDETFTLIAKEVARMERLVRDLQELSRAEAGQIRLEMQPTHLDEILGEACDRLARQFEAKGVRLHREIRRCPPTCADPQRLLQVFTNIIGNALQYTPTGGDVFVRLRCDGSMARIEVQDTGIGIAAEHLPHIFERFYRVDKSRARASGGSGIGLTLSLHLIQQHGGRIEAASEGVGKGSTFTIWVPIRTMPC